MASNGLSHRTKQKIQKFNKQRLPSFSEFFIAPPSYYKQPRVHYKLKLIPAENINNINI